MFIAHRGLVNKFNKENTIKAFKSAINSDKYIGFELDLRVSKDQKFIVYHDLLYKGKLVKNTLYKELKKDNIPLLEEVLNLDTEKIIMIEIKDYKINLKKLAKLLSSYNNKNLYISSFNNKVLKDLKNYKNNIKIGSLNHVLNSEENYSEFDFVCIVNLFLTEDIINYFIKQNIEVFGYGITKKENVKYKNVKYIIDE